MHDFLREVEENMSEKNKKCPYLEAKCADIECDCPKYLAYVDANDEDKVKAVLAEQGFDMSLPAWELMYTMQRSFAARMHKVDELTKEEVDNWVDKYLVCIDDEMREVREHLNLFGDHPVETDEQQVELRKEVIDIIHFVMDLFIVGNASALTIKKAYAMQYLNSRPIPDDVDLIHVAYEHQHDSILQYLDAEGQTDDITMVKALCRLADACGAVRQQISWKHWKKPNPVIDYDKLHAAYAQVFHEFINLCVLTMDSPDDVRDIYVRKNVENIFRQQHGY